MAEGKQQARQPYLFLRFDSVSTVCVIGTRPVNVAHCLSPQGWLHESEFDIVWHFRSAVLQQLYITIWPS
jgi:hypothetical protein